MPRGKHNIVDPVKDQSESHAEVWGDEDSFRYKLRDGDLVRFSAGEFGYADSDDGGLHIKGWAVTNKLNSLNVIVEPQSFTAAVLKEFKKNPLMLWMHDPEKPPLGKWDVVELVPGKGLWVEGHIMPTSLGSDIALLIKEDVIKGLSIAFRTKRIEEDQDKDIVTIKEMARLFEISVVASGVDKHALLQSQTRYADVWDRIRPTPEHDEKHLNTKGVHAMADAPNLSLGDSKAIKDIVDEKLKAQAPTIDQYRSDMATLKDNQEKFSQLMADWQKKNEDLSRDVITQSELKEYQDKIAKDLTELSDRIQKSINAITLSDHKNRAVYTHWRDIIGDARHLVDANGNPLTEREQKAYALFQAPLNERMQGYEILRAIRDCNDAVVICDAYMAATNRRNHHCTTLNAYRQLRDLIMYWDAEFGSAMATSNVATGKEWVPSYLSDRLTEYARLEPSIANYFEHWDMRSQIEKWPLLTGSARVYRAPERLVANPEEYTKSTYGTDSATFTAQNFIGIVPLSTDLLEDSIIGAAPLAVRALAIAHNDAVEGSIMNGDTTATHRDTARSYTTADVETSFMGLRYHAIDLTNSLVVGGAATTDFTAAKCRALRAKLLAHAVDPSKLIWITSMNGFFQMMSFAQTSQPGTYGVGAGQTFATGTLPNFDGSPLVISSKVGITIADDGIDDGDETDNTGLICVHTPSFKIGHRRGVTVEAEKEAKVQQVSIIATQRLSFQKVAAAADKPVAYGVTINVG